MIRSLSTAVSGLRCHQIKMDVVGNNIANVNTVAFKSSQVRFEDLLSQTIQGATAPMLRGGINPSQVGMGIRVSAINNNHNQGLIINTDRDTDLAIERSGFFVVSDGQEYYYTRDGVFGLDANGELVNANGLKVLGWAGAQPDPTGELESLHIPLGERMVAQATGYYGFAGNLDARAWRAATAGSVTGTVQWDDDDIAGLSGSISIELRVDGGAPQTITIGDVSPITNRDDLLNEINSSLSLVGVGAEASFDPDGKLVITSHATGAHSQVELVSGFEELFGTDPVYVSGTDETAEVYPQDYYVYDSQGRRYEVELRFTPTAQNSWTYEAFIGGEAIGSGELVFTREGALDLEASVIEAFTFFPPGASPLVIEPDFSSITQLAGPSTLLVRVQDGFPAGELVAFAVSRTGTIMGTYTNGMVETLGQIAMAYFNNPEGLIKEGGNLYQVTANSGDALIGLPGTEGRGLIRSSSLEMSNTDLSFEFTELITTSRAFQANTRVVSTSDEILVEVINMKR